MHDDDTTQKSPTRIHAALKRLRPETACLIVINGPNLGSRVTLEKRETRIGRSDAADFRIDDESVSRIHALVTRRRERYHIRDNDSTNGTLVNTKPIQEVVLGNQDLIIIGNTIMKFLPNDSVENTYHEELYRLATTDAFLEVHNKTYCLDRLSSELSACDRHHQDLGVIMADIDYFKMVNDTYGHQAGDEVLKQVADLLRIGLRESDILGRYGGEEFLMILPNAGNDQAVTLAERLRKAVEKARFGYRGQDISVTISLGVSAYRLVASDRAQYDDLLECADKALYAAKASGRNRVVSFADIAFAEPKK
jgi:two-component system cell cycle response regulator